MIVCKVCGTENEQGATFCGSCGSFLEWSGETVGGDATAGVGDAGAAAAAAGAAGAAAGPPGGTPPGPPAGSSGHPPGAGPAGPPDPAGAASAGAVTEVVPPPGSITCPACGQVNEPSRVFCSRCATELAPAAPVTAVVAEPPTGRSLPPVALLAVVGAVALVAVLGFAFLLPKGSPTPSSAASDAPASAAGPSAAASGAVASAGASGAPSSVPPSAGPSSGPSTEPSTQPAALTGLVVFSADRNGNADLWTWDPATDKVKRLLKAPGDQTDPAWSPDGGTVVYRDADGLRMVTSDGEPADPPDFTHHGQDRHPAWSPDGRTVVFATDRAPFANLEIATRPAGNNQAALVQLTNNNADDWDPQWSPDGKQIVFVSTRGGHQHLYTMDADGSREREVDLGPGIYDDPMFSPDGQWLGFTRREAATKKALYIARVDGSEMRRLTNSGETENDLAWSPDGSTIAVVRADADYRIVLVNVATGEDVGSFGVDGAQNKDAGLVVADALTGPGPAGGPIGLRQTTGWIPGGSGESIGTRLAGVAGVSPAEGPLPDGRTAGRTDRGTGNGAVPAVVPAKIRVPASDSLARERLERRLATAWRQRLTLVIAPAGSGKTTLVARFAASSGVPAGWYRAETWDADEASLVRHLEASLVGALPGLPGGWRTVEDAARALESCPVPAALQVIDDVHALEGTPAEAALGRFVDYAPPWLGVIVAGRVPPSINLPRLRVSGDLVELGPDDLRFRAWEVEQLFREVYHDPVPPADLAVLARRTEGWAAGLQLFHLATRGRSADERRRVLSGTETSGRLLREYLAQNVLFGLPEELRRFLVDTCVLGRLSGPLCDRLRGGTGSGAMLDELARRSVFTVPVEDADDAYRYHEVLRQHLDRMLVEEVGEAEARARHARAGAVLEADGAPAEALRAYCRAEDWDAVRRLLGGQGERLAASEPSGWVDEVPPAIERHDPWVALAAARRARNDGRWSAAIDGYIRAEAAFGPSRAADAPRRERQRLAAWLDPVAMPTPDAIGSLRTGLVREPGPAGRDALRLADSAALVARGLLLLAAGEVVSARRVLSSAADEGEGGPVAGPRRASGR